MLTKLYKSDFFSGISRICCQTNRAIGEVFWTMRFLVCWGQFRKDDARRLQLKECAAVTFASCCSRFTLVLSYSGEVIFLRHWLWNFFLGSLVLLRVSKAGRHFRVSFYFGYYVLLSLLALLLSMKVLLPWCFVCCFCFLFIWQHHFLYYAGSPQWWQVVFLTSGMPVVSLASMKWPAVHKELSNKLFDWSLFSSVVKFWSAVHSLLCASKGDFSKKAAHWHTFSAQ